MPNSPFTRQEQTERREKFEQIADELLELGYSRTNVAHQMGVDRSLVYRILEGERVATDNCLEKIEEVRRSILRVSPQTEIEVQESDDFFSYD